MPAGLNYPSIAAPTSGDVLVLTAAPDGGGSTPMYAQAVYFPAANITYMTWVRSSGTGPIYLGGWDHTAEASAFTPIQIDGEGGIDDHNNPAILIDADSGKMLILFSAHASPNLFLRVSTNTVASDPTFSGGFAAAVNLDSTFGGVEYTYPAMFQATGVAGHPIFAFVRDVSSSTGRLLYSKTTNAGTTWTSGVRLMTGASGFRPYWAIRGGSTRIDIMTTDREYFGSDGLVDLGHMYLDASTLNVYKSDGTQITATKPFAHSELTQLETNLAGVFPIDGLAGTNPVFTYVKDNGDGTVDGIFARWNGTSWDKGTIYDNETALSLDFGYGGMAINRDDNTKVAAAISTGASSSEMYSFTTADGGLTWSAGTALTSGSGDWNVNVFPVEASDGQMPFIWRRGTYTSSSSFNFSLRGLKV